MLECNLMYIEQDRPIFGRAKNALFAYAVNRYIRNSPDAIRTQRIFPAKGREGVDFIPGTNFYRHSRDNVGKIPVLTYHPLGNVWVAIEVAAEKLGIKTFAAYQRELSLSCSIAPAPITQADKELGRRYMPEQMCGPIYATSGYLMSRQNEFDLKPDNHYQLFLTHISSKTCKEREYAPLEEAVLTDRYAQKNGLPFDFYGVLETPVGLKQLVKLLAKLGQTDEYHAVMAISSGIQRTKAAEALDRITLWEQSMMSKTNINQAEELLNLAKDTLVTRPDLRVQAVIDEYAARIRALPKIASAPKGKILITGEIFHCAEIASSSYNLARILVESGYYPYVDAGLGHYLDQFEFTPAGVLKQLIRKMIPWKHGLARIQSRIAELIRDYGGHARKIFTSTVMLEELSYDGMGVLSPFLCTPNIVTRNVTIPIERRLHKPILHIDISEQTSDTGIRTRAEAFTDAIEQQKRTSYLRGRHEATPRV